MCSVSVMHCRSAFSDRSFTEGGIYIRRGFLLGGTNSEWMVVGSTLIIHSLAADDDCPDDGHYPDDDHDQDCELCS